MNTINPEINKRMLPWQHLPLKAAVAGLRVYGSFLDASDTGVGKTAIAVATCAQLKLRPVVLCIHRSKSHWWWMLEHFGFGRNDADVEAWSMIRTGKTSLGHWQLVRPKNKKKSPFKRFVWTVPRGCALVFDEAHKAGGGLDTQQGKLLVAGKRQGYPCLLLSATAAATHLRMQALGYTLGLFESPLHFIPWLIQQGYRNKPRRGFIYQGSDAQREASLKRIHRQIFTAGKGVRLRKDEVPGFPAQSIFVEAIDFDDAEEISKQYREIRDIIIMAEAKSISARNANEAIVRARQHIELLKVPTLAGMAEDALEEGMSVVIFLNFRQSAFALSSELTCPLLIGGTPQREQDRIVIDFQSNRNRVLVATYGCGSDSINLQDEHGGHPRMGIHNPHYSAINTIQAVGRLHRATGKSKTIQKFVFAAGTVETSVMELNREKIRNIKLLNDGALVALPHAGEQDFAMA